MLPFFSPVVWGAVTGNECSFQFPLEIPPPEKYPHGSDWKFVRLFADPPPIPQLVPVVTNTVPDAPSDVPATEENKFLHNYLRQESDLLVFNILLKKNRSFLRLYTKPKRHKVAQMEGAYYKPDIKSTLINKIPPPESPPYRQYFCTYTFVCYILFIFIYFHFIFVVLHFIWNFHLFSLCCISFHLFALCCILFVCTERPHIAIWRSPASTASRRCLHLQTRGLREFSRPTTSWQRLVTLTLTLTLTLNS